MNRIFLTLTVLILFSFCCSTSHAITLIEPLPISFETFSDEITPIETMSYHITSLEVPPSQIFLLNDSEHAMGHNSILFYLNTVLAGTSFHEINPCIDIDCYANPYVVYSRSTSATVTQSSDIYFQRSLDQGQTWPNNQLYVWEKPDTTDINPTISVFDNGLHAIGTHEVLENNSYLFLHNYMDLSNPNSWVMTKFDLTPTVSNVKESTITTYGDNTIAISGVVDVSYHEYELDGTLVIFWSENGTEEQWPGLFLINQNEDGEFYDVSDLSADSGDFIYVLFLLTDPGIDTSLCIAYCPSDTLIFEEWNLGIISSGRHTIVNPDIAVDGSNAYVVFQEDRRGSMDIVCFSKLEGGFWRRSYIALSAENETNPVISAVGDKAICLYQKSGNLYEVQTDDAGTSWSQPKQINDVPGSVVVDSNGCDVSGYYGVWVDNRYDNHDILLSEVGALPMLRLEDISGGLSLKATVMNYGNAPERDIEWSINITGSLLPKTKTGMIQMINPGKSQVVSTGMIFGFSDIEIQVKIGELSADLQGFLSGPFIFIK